VTLELDPDPNARTTVLMSGRAAYVFDHDTMEWKGVPFSVSKDEPVFALDYSQPIGALQLTAGVMHADPEGARDFPLPDLSSLVRDPPFSDTEWTDATALPEFKLPAYSFSRCAQEGLCLRRPTDLVCGPCTATVSTPRIEEPALPMVSPHARRQTCPAKSAHFLDGAGCEPVGAVCPVEPPGAVRDAAELLAALQAGTSSITLAAGRFELGLMQLSGPLRLRGCGGDTVLALAPGAVLVVASATVAFENLRIEGGEVAIAVPVGAGARLSDVSIDSAGIGGINSDGTLSAERLSIEGRSNGIHATGDTILRNVSVRDATMQALVCVFGSMSIGGLVVHGTPTGPGGRGILLSNGCRVSMEQVLVERGRRIAIETLHPETTIRAADVTIRDVGFPEIDGSGGLVDRGRARFDSIERVWIENVTGAGIAGSDPNAVLRDVRIDGVMRGQLNPAGIRYVLADVDSGAFIMERVQISGVSGTGIYLERNNYQPAPARAILRDITLSTLDDALSPAVVVKSIDFTLERARLEGGADGIDIYSGSQSTISQLTVARTSRYGVNLRADVSTTLEADDMFFTDCNDGLRAFQSFESPSALPERHLIARRVRASGCRQYGILVQGARATVEDFTVENNGVGFGIGALSTVSVSNGVVMGNVLGARVAPDIRLEQVLVDVRFGSNTNGIEISAP
jgi:hypothetical protein